jgi:hypothetical protein
MINKDKSFTDKPYTGRHTRPITDKQKLEDVFKSIGIEFGSSHTRTGIHSVLVEGLKFSFDDLGGFSHITKGKK